MDDLISVEVVYIGLQNQAIKSLEVPVGCTVGKAITLSGIENEFIDIDLDIQKLGVFGRIVKREDILKARDRIEIYRPLLVDPKEARRRRAKK